MRRLEFDQGGKQVPPHGAASSLSGLNLFGAPWLVCRLLVVFRPVSIGLLIHTSLEIDYILDLPYLT